jgi:magnesium transporter
MAFQKRHPALGARPGSLVVPEDAHPTRIHLIAYGPEQRYEQAVDDPEELSTHLEGAGVLWIDVNGIRDVHILEKIAHSFHIHPLALEDAVNVPVRPKSEEYDHNHLIVLRMAHRLEGGEMQREQVTVFLGEKSLITVQEKPGDVFRPVRKRTETGQRMRAKGPDYLAYAIIDVVIDAYFPVLEPFGTILEDLESEIVESARQEQVTRLMELRHELRGLRRDVLPMRELVHHILRGESRFFEDETKTFLRDCADHAVQIVEVIDTYLETITQLMGLHASVLSNRMNEVMKVLTIIATIFIPLSFLAGLYGMNFEWMPELQWKWAYPVVLFLMFLVGGGLVFYFRRRGWLGDGSG